MSTTITVPDQSLDRSRRRAPPRDIVRLLRPHQWTKNLLCLAGVIFSGKFLVARGATEGLRLDWGNILLALGVFGLFCLASSAIYAFNDVMDRQRDRLHPIKRNRPVASGAIGVTTATVISLALAVLALGGAMLLGAVVLLWVVLYMSNSLAYALKFKHVALLDVLSVSIGFVLRLLAGCYAVAVMPTSWIVLCTFFLALFLAAAKRRAELAALLAAADAAAESGDEDAARRPVLARYSVAYLDALVNNAAAMAIMSYALFTIFKNPTLVVTVPIVVYGIMHYKRVMMLQAAGEEPDRALIRDVRIQLAIVLWLAVFSLVMYLELRHGIRLFEDSHPVKGEIVSRT